MMNVKQERPRYRIQVLTIAALMISSHSTRYVAHLIISTSSLSIILGHMTSTQSFQWLFLDLRLPAV
jgi:hypothetical protein